MFTAKLTKNLTGITLEGEYSDLYEMMECVYRITGLEEDYNDPYWALRIGFWEFATMSGMLFKGTEMF